jgi:hypothetical protein
MDADTIYKRGDIFTLPLDKAEKKVKDRSVEIIKAPTISEQVPVDTSIVKEQVPNVERKLIETPPAETPPVTEEKSSLLTPVKGYNKKFVK